MQIEIDRRWLRVLLGLHALIYATFFVFAIANLDTPMRHQTNFIILLVWTAALLAHVVLHYTRIEQETLQRNAYRSGYANAVREMADRSYDAGRLALDDDGEFAENREKGKRHL